MRHGIAILPIHVWAAVHVPLTFCGSQNISVERLNVVANRESQRTRKKEKTRFHGAHTFHSRFNALPNVSFALSATCPINQIVLSKIRLIPNF